MSDTLDTLDTERGGNTSTPRIRSRGWAFTLNNYSDDDMAHIHTTFQSRKMCDFIIGRETGDGGTPHLQGYVRFKNAVSFNTIKKIMPKAHIEKAKGSIKDNYNYCKKDGDYITNIELRSKREIIRDKCLDEYKNVEWRKFQQDVIDIINKPPDRRKIHWFWEPTGNVGKSYLAKYLALTYNVIICEGKKENIFNQVNIMLDKGTEPKIVLLDVPRSAQDYLTYGAIEQLKNGMLYSGKYEGGQCIFPIPTVIVFANAPPNLTAMSADRWDIKMIESG